MTDTLSFTTTWEFQAPRALLYAMYTRPEHLAEWLTPAGFRSIRTDMDFRVGGIYFYGIEGPNGMQMWGRQVYREIADNERLVVVQSFCDAGGQLVRHPMVASWPLEMLSTTTFEDVPGSATLARTRVTITWQPYNTDVAGNASFEGARTGMEIGFADTFTRLETYLARRGAGE